jgi:hypothetical protein
MGIAPYGALTGALILVHAKERSHPWRRNPRFRGEIRRFKIM